MADFSAFRPYIMPEVPGCPQLLVDDAVREASRQFSLDTWLVTYDVPSFNTVVGTQSYTPTPPAQHEVLAVATVVKNGSTELDPSGESTAAKYAPRDGSPVKFWFKSAKLWFDSVPDSIEPILVEAVIRPTQAATTVDDQYLEYRDIITAYAKAKLMAMAGKSWYSPPDSNAYYIAYTVQVSKQKVRKNSGRSAAPLRAVAPFF